MICRETIMDESGTTELCLTYSSNRYKLLQADTGVVYGFSCVDVIAGFEKDGTPYPAHQYEETDEIDDSQEEHPFAEYGGNAT